MDIRQNPIFYICIKRGDEYTDVTGGWIGNATKNTDNIYVHGITNGTTQAQTNNNIDLTDYSTLYVDVNVISVLSSQYGFRIYGTNAIFYLPVVTVGRGVYSVDISSINTECVIYMSAEWSPLCKASVYNVWLEK